MDRSRIPKFYQASVPERLEILREKGILNKKDYLQFLNGENMLPIEEADKIIENVFGVFSMPMGLGLNFLIDEENMCSVLTTVMVPPHVSVSELRQKFREKSIIIYEGKGHLKDKVFQVGNIGELSFKDMEFFLDSLRKILQSYQVSETQINPTIGLNENEKNDVLSFVQ